MAVSARMVSAGLLPLVMRKRATVEPVMARFSEASSVKPTRPTAACSCSTVTLPAIWSTTSSLTKRVSVGGGISIKRWLKPVGSCCCCGPVGPGGCCCGGSRIPPCTVLNAAGPAGLSAASCAGPLPTRLLMTCTEPGSDASRSSENSGNGWDVEPDGGRMPGPVGIGGAFGGPGGIGGPFGRPVTMLPGPVTVTTPVPVEFVIVPVLVPTKAPTVPFAPLLVPAPEAVESAMVPPLTPTKPPTVLLAPELLTAPEAVESEIVPVLAPTKPPTVLLAPVLLTAPEAVEAVIAPALAPTKPPAALVPATVTLPLACEPVMTPPTELDATSPPAMLASPVCTLPVATDERIVPELLPTKPPA